MKVITSPDTLADAVHELASQSSSVDLSPIREAIEQIEGYRTKAVLRAMADLEAVKAAKGRRFIVAYWYEDKAYTAHGFASADEPKKVADDDDEGKEEARRYRVLVDDYHAPFCGHYLSMERFENALNRHKLPYVIKYLD